MADDVLKTLIAEAYGEGPEGMRLVAETILNRAAIRGMTPEEVVRQRHQYTGLRSPGPAARRAWESPEAIAAAEEAWRVALAPGDPTDGADHYYAPGTISQPYWAKSMRPTTTAGGHAFYASRPVPPGELNQVASALSTTRTPPPVPPRRPDSTRSALRSPGASLGDELALNPLPGGRQTSPLFDGEYSPLSQGMIRLPSPARTWGVNVPRVPVPATQSAQLAGQRNTRPEAQQAANQAAQQARARVAQPTTAPRSADIALMRQANQQAADAERNRTVVASYPTTPRAPARLPTLAPPANARQPAFNGDPLTPANGTVVARIPTAQPPTTRMVQSVPVRPTSNITTARNEQAAARGNGRQQTPAPTRVAGFPTTQQILSGTGFIGGAQVTAPERLAASEPGLPERYGTPRIAGIGGSAIAPIPAVRPAQFTPQQPQRVAPIPAQRSGLAQMPPMPVPRPRVAPVPQSRPNFGMGGPLGPALVAPIPARQSQAMLVRRTPAPSLYYTRPTTFGYLATNQSGDDSVGSQADAAAARSSGEGGRNRRY